MKKILITGATDGIGRQTAIALANAGHHVLVHGRDAGRMAALSAELNALSDGGPVTTYLADLSVMADAKALALQVKTDHPAIDVVINNAGVLRTPNPVTVDGLDSRLAVNTIAPYVLAQELLSALGADGRVVNVSSAAQAAVTIDALIGKTSLDDMAAYSQSKLAIMMWTNHLASTIKGAGPIVVSVNPGSLLGTKMVKEGFGIDGKDIQIGADILVRASLSDEFVGQSGKYYDNDAGQFGTPHSDALDAGKCAALVQSIENILAKL